MHRSRSMQTGGRGGRGGIQAPRTRLCSSQGVRATYASVGVHGGRDDGRRAPRALPPPPSVPSLALLLRPLRSAVHALARPAAEAVEARGGGGRRGRRHGGGGRWRSGHDVDVGRGLGTLGALCEQPRTDLLEEGAGGANGGGLGRRAGGGDGLGRVRDRSDVRDRALLHVQQVGGPVVEAVKDVRRVDDGGAAHVALLLEELEQRLPRDHVEVGGHLVHQQQLRRSKELQEQLGAAALSVRHLVEAPLHVHVQQRDEPVHPRGEHRRVHAVAHERLGELLGHVPDGEVCLEGDAVADARDGARPVAREQRDHRVEAEVVER
mmetsp:Transcript_39907/g.68485  ORF Transcript_39907/g.68485 Transcript_39907/m.68485 type:complete len:322 (+) Transcript_39907:364-1329(+)